MSRSDQLSHVTTADLLRRVEDSLPALPTFWQKARRRLEAEVRARWPCYQRSRRYRALAREAEALKRRPLETTAKARSSLADVMATQQRLLAVYKAVLDEFGLLTVIPPKLSVEAILADRQYSQAFGWKLLPVVCAEIRPIPPGGADQLKHLLDCCCCLPVNLYLLRSKKEILDAVGTVVDAWQDRLRQAGVTVGRRYRERDLSLFPLYVEAALMRRRRLSLKQIAQKLFPTLCARSVAAAVSAAELYAANGELLLRGESERIRFE